MMSFVTMEKSLVAQLSVDSISLTCCEKQSGSLQCKLNFLGKVFINPVVQQATQCSDTGPFLGEAR